MTSSSRCRPCSSQCRAAAPQLCLCRLLCAAALLLYDSDSHVLLCVLCRLCECSNYQSALERLSYVEKEVFRVKINALNAVLDQGCKELKWNALAILDFNKKCENAISDFVLKVQSMQKEAAEIQREVDWLQFGAKLVDVKRTFEARKEVWSMEELLTRMEKQKAEVVADMVRRYQTVIQTKLKHIEYVRVRACVCVCVCVSAAALRCCVASVSRIKQASDDCMCAVGCGGVNGWLNAGRVRPARSGG
jgi:hypothetical protein